jgi:hypothetical protein
MKRQIRKLTASASVLMMLWGAAAPAWAGAPADDLKQIEYKYYFRGKYPQAIDALQIFLARVDVTGDVALRAGEFLAASHVLSGAPVAGQDVFARIITAHPEYAGPDAAVFKPEVMDAYGKARSDYAALALRNTAPAATDTVETAANQPPSTATPATGGKPIYKKWWFYAGTAAVVGVVAGLAGGSGGGDAPRAAKGSVTIGVTVH